MAGARNNVILLLVLYIQSIYGQQSGLINNTNRNNLLGSSSSVSPTSILNNNLKSSNINGGLGSLPFNSQTVHQLQNMPTLNLPNASQPPSISQQFNSQHSSLQQLSNLQEQLTPYTPNFQQQEMLNYNTPQVVNTQVQQEPKIYPVQPSIGQTNAFPVTDLSQATLSQQCPLQTVQTVSMSNPALVSTIPVMTTGYGMQPVNNRIPVLSTLNYMNSISNVPAVINTPQAIAVSPMPAVLAVANPISNPYTLSPNQNQQILQSRTMVNPIPVATIQTRPTVDITKPTCDQTPFLQSILMNLLQPSSPSPPQPVPQPPPAECPVNLPNPQFPYQAPSSKSSSFKALLPIIINLLKERTACRCNQGCNCECRNRNNMNPQEPQVLTGYANKAEYGQNTDTLSKMNDMSDEIEEFATRGNKYRQVKSAVDSNETKEVDDNDSDEED